MYEKEREEYENLEWLRIEKEGRLGRASEKRKKLMRKI